MLIQADARSLPLQDGCVQCVVTSPPYFALRDYGMAQQIGLEPSPDTYVDALVGVFREVRRVLRDDGVVWCNLGDSYAGSGKGGNPDDSSFRKQATNVGSLGGRPWRPGAIENPRNGAHANRNGLMNIDGLKPKDLAGIPWRVAFALQADGWYLRSDIIWAKPNPMPESVTDRPTKSHEYLFLLAKSERYYYDQAAIYEPLAQGSVERYQHAVDTNEKFDPARHKHTDESRTHHAPMEVLTRAAAGVLARNARNKRTVWNIPTMPYTGAHFATMPEKLVEPCILAGSRLGGKRCDCDEVIATPLGDGGSNDPTMLTGRAGMNRPRRPNEGTRPITRREQRDYAEQLRLSPFREVMATAAGEAFAHYIRTDRSGARPIPPPLLADWLGRGWLKEPAPCGHPSEPADLILDPFSGSGTVLAVAERLGRRAVGVDLNPAYHQLAKQRTRQRGIRWG